MKYRMDSPEAVIQQNISLLPASMQAPVSHGWDQYSQRLADLGLDIPSNNKFLKSVAKVWAISQFVSDTCRRYPTVLIDLVESGDLFSASIKPDYTQLLEQEEIASEEILVRVLRRFRNKQMVRIAWRDIAGWATVEETLEDVSALAEACLQLALDYIYAKACKKMVAPVLSDGTAQQLVVLAMGKLGAFELNFSSDVDLIFAYPEEGVLADRYDTTYTEFFTRLCRKLIHVFSTVTEDGFVFRVDTRLRPYGDSGPLVMSFSAMESYYQSQAREWERYAMIKIRPVEGDKRAGEQLVEMLRPFVYRRYLDYGAFAELRELKFKISQELQRKDRMENIKLGPGGIREIEFVGQAFQLIRGGRDKALQEGRILTVLTRLKEHSLLPAFVVRKLTVAYRYLRTVENRLQQFEDQQIHDLPSDTKQRARLAYALGFDQWRDFKQELDGLRDQVHSVFEQVFQSPQSIDSHGDADLIWLGVGEPQELSNMALRLGYKDPKNTLAIIAEFRQAYVIRKLSKKGMEYLDDLMPMLFAAVGATKNPDITLKRLLNLLEAIASRSVYLSLLVENPLALSQLVKLTAASPWIVAYISRTPLLLDELLDPRSLYAPLQKDPLQQDLAKRLETIDPSDLERLMIELRHFKQANVLRVAAADIMDIIPIAVVSDYLTDIADVVIDRVILSAWQLVANKHGVPSGANRSSVSGFGIVAYGKLGGIELGYGSDLDLVFLYDAQNAGEQTDGPRPLSCAQFYGRVGQRIIHILNTNMLAGVLYEVDMRLRPGGNSGLLVASVDGYDAYQASQAWTWEHQALVRSRFVAGDADIEKRFKEIRRHTLCQPRDLEHLRQEVSSMREKMRANLVSEGPGQFDLKQGRGGIADIEFIVQFGVLSRANESPQLHRFSDTIRLLDSLQANGFLVKGNVEFLKKAYYQYRILVHKAALQDQKAVISANEFDKLRSGVWQIWQELMER